MCSTPTQRLAMRLPWAFRDDEDVMDSRYSSVMVKLIDLRTAGPPPLTSLVNMVMEWIEFLQASAHDPRHGMCHLRHLSEHGLRWHPQGLRNLRCGVGILRCGYSPAFLFRRSSLGLVAWQSMTSMAVANVIGANVMNVFHALLIPWPIQS